MRTYELMYVLDPRLSDEEADEVNKTVRKLVTDNGAAITQEDSWGRRKLAYPIEKQTEGRYMLLYLHAEDAFPGAAEVERRLEQSDRVLRYLTVRTDPDVKRAHGQVTPELAVSAGGGSTEEEEEA